MKKLLIFLMILLVGLSLTAQSITIEKVVGKVQISSGGSTWSDAAVGTQVTPGTMISTGFKSTATLNTGDGTVEVAQLTRLTLQELLEEEDSVTTTLFLNGGRINAEVSRERVRQDFTVHSPIATASVRGTGFSFDGRTLDLEHGAVMFISGGRAVLALPGDRIRVLPAGIPVNRMQALAEQIQVQAVVSIVQEEDLDVLLGLAAEATGLSSVDDMLDELEKNADLITILNEFGINPNDYLSTVTLTLE